MQDDQQLPALRLAFAPVAAIWRRLGLREHSEPQKIHFSVHILLQHAMNKYQLQQTQLMDDIETRCGQGMLASSKMWATCSFHEMRFID